MATLKELHQGDKVWRGCCNNGIYNGNFKKLTREQICDAEDVKEVYDADNYKSLTVPGQSKSISELMERYEKGRPTPEL